MKSLYALSIDGTMFFATGELSEKDYEKLDKVARIIQDTKKDKSPEDKCYTFFDVVKAEYNIGLMRVPIKHVFRI